VTESLDSRRLELVRAAQQQWIAALTDLGGRNTLLYYKDRRAGTLDLAEADPEAMDRFTQTGSIRLARLFKDVDLRADAIRRMQAIHRKARELLEERGIRAGYLATGMARWDELFLEPAAPVLLRGLTITPTRARYDDFELVLDDEEEVNPVLVHKLTSVFGAEMAKLTPQNAGDRLRAAAAAAEVPGFEITDRRVIGTFTYAKLPMVRDMEAAGDLLAESDLVAAIAGDPEAQELVSADRNPAPEPAAGKQNAARPARAEGGADSPEDDYSVLDADSSQRRAIDTVLAGQSLVIHGPPGTGKSQTIANLIAALVARGRKVLFVAEKRAAIDAVLSRLKGVGLGDVVLDIHEGTRDRQRIASDLGATLDLAGQTASPDVGRLHRRLVDRVQRLSRHVSALHEVHEPWGLTPFAVQSALLGIPETARTPFRLPAPERVDGEAAETVRDELREFGHLGGFTLRPSTTPWYGALLRTAADAQRAIELAGVLDSETLPMFAHRTEGLAADSGLRPRRDYAEQAALMKLYAAIGQTLQIFDPAVYRSAPASLATATGDGEGMGMLERRRLRGQARSLWRGAGDKPSWETLRVALDAAAGQLAEWQRLSAREPGEPSVPAGYAAVARLHADAEQQLAALRALIPTLPATVESAVRALAGDSATPWQLPRLYQLARRFDRMGLRPLLDELARKKASGDLAAATFDHAWYCSILDQIRVRDPRYAAERGTALDEIADDFRQRDVEHLAANRSRVRRTWAEMTRDAEDRHPLQARVIRKQAALRRGHLPLRRLLDQVGDVLFAVKPCWAMSPLMVSQVLPAARLFDVVIFDEASQIVPADAIASIIRAHQVVVAGDDHQLPPTNFFRQFSDPAADDEDDDETVSFGAGFESVLDALRPLLPTAPLNWHYRSRDERLVAFSNEHIYGGALTTFPGVVRDDCLRHVVVAQDDSPGQDASVTAEVNRVVELILEHARTRPSESLGVIALGVRHAERIDLALREALAGVDPQDEAFFADDGPEPFFVKNLERVQGDERDAIILSIGYGKHRDGRMRYQWGPLLRDGGERRLNVAATRAKHRLTVVSSFSSHDVDPERLTKAGARLLAEYLEYAGSGGTPVAAEGGDAADAFAASVASRLAEYGITVVARYGVGGYRVDFAAAHPDDPARMILAVEADGASYRDSGSVRDRDRLRKEHLERLGWRFHRLWSTNWFNDPDAEVAKLRQAYDQAVASAPRPEPPQPPQPPQPFEPPQPFGPPDPFEPPPPPPAPPSPPEPLEPSEPPIKPIEPPNEPSGSRRAIEPPKSAAPTG